jgi:8-oxo-dGTP pyrophosphatase MutT (NUDIX family)
MNQPEDEIVQIVDRKNREIGTCPRSVMREQRLIHRACYILVFNGRHELFVQKRTLTKDIYPGRWDIAAGGVVLADESYAESAKRELREELGIESISLEFLFDHFYEDQQNRVWGRIFTCTHEGPFSLQAQEIDSGRFMTVGEALDLSIIEPFTPDSLEILKKIEDGISPSIPSQTLFLHGQDSSSRGTKGRYFSENFPGIIIPDFIGSLYERMQALERICRTWDRLVMIGSSFGGLMATCYAITYPEKVRKLILLAPALNFSEFSPPADPLYVSTLLIIGKNDTITPPDLVIPAAKRTFRNLDIICCDDDHLLRTTFFTMDWPSLLT